MKRYIINIILFINNIIHKIDYYNQNPMFKGIFIIGGTTAISQLLSVILMPLITRLYAPYDYGIFSTFPVYSQAFLFQSGEGIELFRIIVSQTTLHLL